MSLENYDGFHSGSSMFVWNLQSSSCKKEVFYDIIPEMVVKGSENSLHVLQTDLYALEF